MTYFSRQEFGWELDRFSEDATVNDLREAIRSKMDAGGFLAARCGILVCFLGGEPNLLLRAARNSSHVTKVRISSDVPGLF